MKTNMKPLLILAAAALLLTSACDGQLPMTPRTTAGSSDIIGGTTDTGDDAVALIVFQDPSNAQNTYVCTGTLIAQNVLLTAGHCGVTDETCNSPGGPSTCHANPASGYEVLGGTNPVDSATWQTTNPTWYASVSSVHPHPGYGSDSTGAPVNDVSVMILGSIHVLSGSAPAPMPWLSSPNNAAYATGTHFRAAGYGITSGTTQAGVGTKRKVTLTIAAHNTMEFSFGSSTANTCSGDSGGPAIASINGVDTLIGTTSYGDQNCTQIGVDMRVDALANFIAPFTTGGTTSTPTPAPSSTPTPSPTSTPPAGSNLLANPGFESTLTGTWSAGGAKKPTSSTINHHTGTHALLAGQSDPHGSYAPIGNSYAYQPVHIPVSGATLTFWMWTGTSDTIAYSWQDGYITDPQGNILGTLFHLCDDSETWKQKAYDLSNFAGQDVLVYFNVHQDGASLPSTMFIDDVSLTAD